MRSHRIQKMEIKQSLFPFVITTGWRMEIPRKESIAWQSMNHCQSKVTIIQPNLFITMRHAFRHLFWHSVSVSGSDEVASHRRISLALSVLSLSPGDTIHKKYPSLVSFYPLSLDTVRPRSVYLRLKHIFLWPSTPAIKVSQYQLFRSSKNVNRSWCKILLISRTWRQPNRVRWVMWQGRLEFQIF